MKLEHAIGWRVPPCGRAAHYLTTPELTGSKYYTACGLVLLATYVDVVPTAKHCKRCERRLEQQRARGAT